MNTKEAAKIVREYRSKVVDSLIEDVDLASQLSSGLYAVLAGEANLPGDEILNLPIQYLELEARGRRYCEQENIKTIGELLLRSEKDIVKTRGIGRRTLYNIRSELGEYGLLLGIGFRK